MSMNVDLGLFEVKSGKVVVSDPCYTLDTWCQEVIDNVANGTWVAEVNRSDEGMWGIRNAELIAYNKAYGEPKSFEWSYYSNNIGVDSGQAGFYDFDTYRKDDIAQDKDKADFGRDYDQDNGDVWYRHNCYQTLEREEQAGVIEGGVVSSSGYGDGSYTVEIAVGDGKIVGLRLLFLGEVCDYCEEYESNCSCSYCDVCGYHEEECDCEFCDECGEHEDECYCDDEEDGD